MLLKNFRSSWGPQKWKVNDYGLGTSSGRKPMSLQRLRPCRCFGWNLTGMWTLPYKWGNVRVQRSKKSSLISRPSLCLVCWASLKYSDCVARSCLPLIPAFLLSCCRINFHKSWKKISTCAFQQYFLSRACYLKLLKMGSVYICDSFCDFPPCTRISPRLLSTLPDVVVAFSNIFCLSLFFFFYIFMIHKRRAKSSFINKYLIHKHVEKFLWKSDLLLLPLNHFPGEEPAVLEVLTHPTSSHALCSAAASAAGDRLPLCVWTI